MNVRALTAIIVMAVLCADATAAVRDASEHHPVDVGPVLAGPGVAYVPAHGHERARVRVAARGEERDVARLAAAPKFADDPSFADRAIGLAIGGGENALVVRLVTVFSHPDGSPTRYALQSFAGPPSGPLPAVSPVCESTDMQAFPDLGADGALAATTGPACGEASVLDVTTGARRPLPAAQRGSIEVAGELVAWLEPVSGGGVVAVVVDGQDRELLRVTAPGTVAPDTDLALAPDGTIALRYPTRRGPRVVTASPARPTLRRVRLPPRTSSVSGIRLAGGRLAVLRSVAGRNRLTAGEVTTLSPTGGDPRTELRGVDAYGGEFDFDGTHVAATARTCGGVVLVRERVGGTAGRTPNVRDCRLRLAERPRLTRRGLRIELSCRGFDRSCAARTLVARLGGSVLARARTPIFSRTVTLRLDADARRLLRSQRRVFVTARIADAPSEASAPPRSTTARVR